MTKATTQAQQAFQNFSNGKIDKWGMYSIIFNLMDAGKITLRALCSIGPKYGITAGAIKMRRCDWLEMK